MRFIGLDVHQGFCEVAIRKDGKTRAAGRIETDRAALELFAGSLCATDEVALEATGPAMEIARILEGHVGRVVVANAQEVRAISHQIDFLDQEIAQADCKLSAWAVNSQEARRLMSIPGVGPGVAVTLMSAIGDISRFSSPRQLVAYLGLDPKVHQSGDEPPRHGRISKRGNAQARSALVEAAG